MNFGSANPADLEERGNIIFAQRIIGSGLLAESPTTTHDVYPCADEANKNRLLWMAAGALTCFVVSRKSLSFDFECFKASSGRSEDPALAWRKEKQHVAMETIERIRAMISRRVYARLRDLVNAVEDDYPEIDYPAAPSLLLLAQMLNALPNLHAPQITLSSGGHVIAEWLGPQGRRLAMMFLPDQTINFSARAPDSARRGKLMPLYGSAGLSTLLNRLRTDDALAWLTRTNIGSSDRAHGPEQR